ncbi:MAG: hypothetical protein JW894_00850 [Bacteroidales bacterium]|nr:hypothetical protein [Bacteroidales bacterium]
MSSRVLPFDRRSNPPPKNFYNFSRVHEILKNEVLEFRDNAHIRQDEYESNSDDERTVISFIYHSFSTGGSFLFTSFYPVL